jgi:histidinol-phosphate aminotransferase
VIAWRQVLEAEFPGEDSRYFPPMVVGNTPASANAGAEAIVKGFKTATSSMSWDYPDGRIPFVGALSVLLDGLGQARAIVETQRIEIMPFGSVDEAFAHAYGEGDRTLAWWRVEIGAWYREAAARHGQNFSDETAIICEWFAVVRQLSGPSIGVPAKHHQHGKEADDV